MNRDRWICVLVIALGAIGIGVVTLSGLPARGAAQTTGAAPASCYDCKDMACDYCPPQAKCKHRNGFCTEVIRNVSQFCVPAVNGEWERCKYRVDDAGACVVLMVNPCTPEAPFCATPREKCGPLGLCIPEGVCIP